ncbi:MAG: hypothetical protein JJU07_16180 [Natronohydrobacter sp.]|nr:hypothetical protein [Natronohydrobacter sp.]
MTKEQMITMIEEAKQRAEQEIPDFSSFDEDKKATAICSFFPESQDGNHARLFLRFGELISFAQAPWGSEWLAYDGKCWVGGEKAITLIDDMCKQTAAKIVEEIPFLTN